MALSNSKRLDSSMSEPSHIVFRTKFNDNISNRNALLNQFNG
jgi:hypothetical protein